MIDSYMYIAYAMDTGSPRCTGTRTHMWSKCQIESILLGCYCIHIQYEIIGNRATGSYQQEFPSENTHAKVVRLI